MYLDVNLTPYEKLTQMDHRAKCNHKNYETLEESIREKSLWLQINQTCLSYKEKTYWLKNDKLTIKLKTIIVQKIPLMEKLVIN